MGTPGPELTLTRDGLTDYVVVIPARPTPQEQKAAGDLARWLGEMTHVEFKVVPDTADPIPTEISVGRTSRLNSARVPQAEEDLGAEGLAIGAQGERLFLELKTERENGGKSRGRPLHPGRAHRTGPVIMLV